MILDKSPLIREICIRRPQFSYSNSFLFLKDSFNFLRGFALDMPPGGLYIIKYMFPLFSDAEFIHLSYGYRLSNGYVNLKGAKRDQIVNAILTIIDDNYDFSEEESIREFLAFLHDPRISREARREGESLVEFASTTDNKNLVEIIERNRQKYSL